MADKRITELTNITGANLADADEFVVVDSSASETKAITWAELKSGLDTSTGFVRVTGDTMTGNLTFGDNNKAIFGAGSDLQIYHDGTHSRISDEGTGNLILKGSSAIVFSAVTNGEHGRVTDGGGWSLGYSGSEKLATTSTGVDVTGQLVADSGQFDGNVNIDGTVTADGLQVTNTATTGTNQEVASFRTASGGGLSIKSSDLSSANPDSILEPFYGESLKVRTSGNDRLKVQDNGDISFYEDTGTTPKFFWDASAESLGIGTSSPSSYAKFTLQGSGTEAIPTDALVQSNDASTLQTIWNSDNSANYSGIKLETRTSAASGWLIANEWKSSYLGDLVFRGRTGASTSAEAMRIDSSGRVILGGGSTVGDASADNLTIGQGAGDEGATIYSSATGYGSLFFKDSGSNFDGYVQYKHGDNYLRFGTAFTERMRIDSSGNVGIGTSSPAGKLHVAGGRSYMQTVSGDQYVLKLTNPANADGVWLGTPAADSFAVYTAAGTERLRIDSSGNLLVGKTVNNDTGAGFRVNQNFISSVGDGTISGYFHRLTSDGEIVQFRKDGTSVGSIGTSGGTLIVGNKADHSGVNFGYRNLFPMIGGSSNDGAVSIGSSTGRFKDLYLSGGVYLGGTGAANLLDDYEEGTFTATLDFTTSSTGGLNYTANTFRYIKIGDMVFISGFIVWNQNNFSASSGNLALYGLPFATANSNAYRGGVSVTYSNTPWTGLTVYQQAFRGEINSTNMFFNFSNSTDGSMDTTISSHTNIDSAGEVMITGSYTIA